MNPVSTVTPKASSMEEALRAVFCWLVTAAGAKAAADPRRAVAMASFIFKKDGIYKEYLQIACLIRTENEGGLGQSMWL